MTQCVMEVKMVASLGRPSLPVRGEMERPRHPRAGKTLTAFYRTRVGTVREETHQADEDGNGPKHVLQAGDTLICRTSNEKTAAGLRARFRAEGGEK